MGDEIGHEEVRKMLKDCRVQQTEVFRGWQERTELVIKKQDEIRDLKGQATTKAIEDSMQLSLLDNKRIDKLYKIVFIAMGSMMTISFFLNYKSIAKLLFG